MAMAMAMAGRSCSLLMATAHATCSLRLPLRASPAFSAAAAAASASALSRFDRADCASRSFWGAATGTSVLESELCGGASLARLRFDNSPTCVGTSSFSGIDGGSRRSAAVSSDPHLSSTVGIDEPRRFNAKGLGLQILAGLDSQDRSISRCFSTKVSPPPSNDTAVIEPKDEGEKPKTLEDFQHEEVVGPTVERDLSPVADELRESLEILQKRIASFQKTLYLLGCVQGVGAAWCYVSWHSLNPTWQLLPSALLSFMLAYVLRQALQPITFFGRLEERSRLRIITLSLMIAKGFASFFNRARVLVAASAVGLLCVLLYTPSTYLLGLLGILK